MKIKTLLLFSALVALSFSVFSKGQGDLEDTGLMSTLMTRMSFSPSITINISGSNDIEATFGSNLGVVNILIRNNTGLIIIKRTVDTSIQDNLQLNISNLPADSYTIEFTNAKGRILKTEKFSTQ